MDTLIFGVLVGVLAGVLLLWRQGNTLLGRIQALTVPAPQHSTTPLPVPLVVSGAPAKSPRPHVFLVCMDKNERELVEVFHTDVSIRPPHITLDGTRYNCSGGSASLGYFLYRGEA